MGAGRPGQPLDSGQRGSCRLRIGNLPKVSPPGTGAKTEAHRSSAHIPLHSLRLTGSERVRFPLPRIVAP
eukprot:scaffold100511_cov59-Phaeocystis_antarctica.AAC.2